MAADRLREDQEIRASRGIAERRASGSDRLNKRARSDRSIGVAKVLRCTNGTRQDHNLNYSNVSSWPKAAVAAHPADTAAIQG
jgi:hypothetical protein